MKRFTYTFIILLSLLATSCTSTIDLDLDDPDPVLVVDGFLSDMDTTQWVKLSDLENYFADGSPDLSIHKSAEVTLLENNVAVGTYTFNSQTEQFELNYQGITGYQYQIDVVLSDGSHYLSAEEEMLSVPTLDSIEVAEEIEPVAPGEEEVFYDFNIFTQEPAGLGDNYQWKTYINDQYQYEAQELSFADDRFVDGQYVHDFTVWGSSSENLSEIVEDMPDDSISVTISQIKITQRYYDFLNLVFQQTILVGGPFASPPAEIRGNVYKLGGKDEVLALGYFYTASTSSQTVKL